MDMAAPRNSANAVNEVWWPFTVLCWAYNIVARPTPSPNGRTMEPIETALVAPRRPDRRPFSNSQPMTNMKTSRPTWAIADR